MEIKLVLYLPRDAASVPVTRQLLDGCLQTVGVTPDTRADIALALDEACANVIQHAPAGQAYEVQVNVRNGQCEIEVLNSGQDAPQDSVTGIHGDGREVFGTMLTGDPVPPTAEHGRGLQIIDTVADNLQLTGNEHQGLTVHFEKTLQWLPGTPGQHLLDAQRE